MKRITAFALMAASTVVIADGQTDPAIEAIERLAAAGYEDVRKLELDDGLWEAEVRGDDGSYFDLHIVPESGVILDPRAGMPVLTAAAIQLRLEAEGYTDVDDLDLDGAVWEADARDADGRDVDLVINGFDGEVLYLELDD